MPCMGADCNLAERQGEKAYRFFAEWLKDTHGIPLIEECGKGGLSYGLTIEAHKKLEAAVKDLFVAEACDTW